MICIRKVNKYYEQNSKNDEYCQESVNDWPKYVEREL